MSLTSYVEIRALHDFFFMLLPVFVISGGLGVLLLRWLESLAYRQHAYEDAPQTHQKKTGTPTMGGLLFLFAPLFAIVFGGIDRTEFAFLILIYGSAAIGFYDDYSAIRHGRNRGLSARMKFLLTGIVGVAFLAVIANVSPASPALMFVGAVPQSAWWALSLAVILATTHAVNLTDGLDGLASGTIVPPLLVFWFVAVRNACFGSNTPQVATMIAAIVGGVLAFLIFFNRHKAKMFMGDTGSLALGAALAGAAILTNAQLLLLLVGAVFVAETLSVMIQVTSYKLTKKRVFRMSPLHHHFELGGWSETNVTRSFWLASVVSSLIGFFIVVRV